MANPTEVRHKSGPIFTGSVASSTEIVKGDALWYDSGNTRFDLADSSDHTKPATHFALTDVDSAQDLATRVYASRHVEVNDEDAPYTADDVLWASETAGSITHTRPTTAASLRQPVGEAHTTKIAELVIRPRTIVEVPIQLIYATSANAILDSGNFAGPTMDANGEGSFLNAVLPKNFLRVEAAVLYIAAEATGGAPTMDITVGSAVTGAQHDAVTADAGLVDEVREGSAADEMFELDITDGLDATNIARPGAIIGIKCLQDDAGTDISFVFGGVITCEVAA